MKSSDSLYKLIKSLSGTEKSYIKKFMSFQSADQKNYLILFDAINDLKKYDEKKLKEKLQGHSFISRLGSEKVYLYDQILKGLRAYHAESSIEQKIKNRLSNAAILHKKELYAECLKQLEKVKVMAVKYDMPDHLIKTLQFQADVLFVQGYSESIAKRSNQLFEEIRQILDDYNKFINLKIETINIHFEMLRNWGKQKEKDRTAKIPFPAVLDILKNNKEPKLNYNTKRMFYFSQIYLAIGDNNMGLFEKWNNKLLGLLQDNLHQAFESPKQYLTAVAHQLSIISYYKRYEQIPQVIQKAEQFINDVKEEAPNFFITKIESLLIYCINTARFKDALRHLKEFELFVERNNSPIYLAFFCYLSACCYYVMGDVKVSKRYLTQLLNYDSKILPDEIYFAANVLKLVIFIDTDDFFGYEFQSKQLQKQLDMFGKEKEYLTDIFKIMLSIGDARFLKPKQYLNMKEKKKQMNNLFKKNAFILNSWNYFNPLIWIEAQLQGKKYKEVVLLPNKS